MFYLNAIEQLFLFVEQLEQLEACLPFSRLLTGLTARPKGTTARWHSNKTSLIMLKTLLFVVVLVTQIIMTYLNFLLCSLKALGTS